MEHLARLLQRFDLAEEYLPHGSEDCKSIITSDMHTFDRQVADVMLDNDVVRVGAADYIGCGHWLHGGLRMVLSRGCDLQSSLILECS